MTSPVLRAQPTEVSGSCICGEPGKFDWIMPDDRWTVFCSITCVPTSERQRYGLGMPNRRNRR